ncbi:MAG: peptidylprolyl isomerase [Candidatus Diapherotrites archaeon]
MEHGAVVQINYSAKVVDGEVFDTTIKEVAEKAGILEENMIYRPNAVVVGAEELFDKVDEALKEMHVGEERKVLIDAEDAYGLRDPKLIGVVPFREFKKEKIQPFPGLIIDLNNRRGKVQSVSGGRVRVDFNHPLAGKNIEYELKVEKEIKDLKEKVEVLFEKYFGPIPSDDRALEVNMKEQEVTVSIDAKYKQALAPLEKMFSDLLTKHIVGIKKVKFVSKAEKKKDEK